MCSRNFSQWRNKDYILAFPTQHFCKNASHLHIFAQSLQIVKQTNVRFAKHAIRIFLSHFGINCHALKEKRVNVASILNIIALEF